MSYTFPHCLSPILLINLFLKMICRKNKDSSSLDIEIVTVLKEMLDEHNVLAKSFRYARDRFVERDFGDIKLKLIRKRNTDGRTYNLPSASEVAAIIVGDIDESLAHRDIILETQCRSLQIVDTLHPNYLGLQYPLIFPFGEDGYRPDIPTSENVAGCSSRKRNKVSMREFFAYRIQERIGDSPILLKSKRLFQQFLVDAYTMVEAERLRYIRFNQAKLRVDQYKGLHECLVRGETNAAATGQRIILPSSFTGGPRYMFNNCKDAFAICKYFGYPSFFITMTCNPEWPEVKRYIQRHGVSAEDRPDILCRVFKIKLDELIKDLKSGYIFGKVSACKLLICFFFSTQHEIFN